MPTPSTVLVLCDSLAFHGPERAELTTEPRLWPNVMASRLGPDVAAVVYGRRGWTSRDAWFALTKDPYVYSVLLPQASAVVLAVGGMDYLPSVLPAHLREGIRLLRPPALRRFATGTLRRVQPAGARLLGGRWRTLPASVTDHYVTRAVEGIRFFHPDLPVIGVVPPGHSAPAYGRISSAHPAAVARTLSLGARLGIPLLRQDEWVAPFLGAAEMNPDGLHWGWACHAAVGEHAADVVAAALRRPEPDAPELGGPEADAPEPHGPGS